MTTFSKDVFDRLKNISQQDFIKALEKDGFVRDVESRQSSGDTIPNPASIQYCVPGIRMVEGRRFHSMARAT